MLLSKPLKAGKLYCLFITKDKAELVSAEDYRGMKNYELVAALQTKYGDKVAVISTGLAGERGYKGASVSLTDIFGDPSRNAARGGLGAVMGSKGLKAIILDPTGTDQVAIAQPDDFPENCPGLGGCPQARCQHQSVFPVRHAFRDQ